MVMLWPSEGDERLLGVKAQGLLDLQHLGLRTPSALILRSEITTRRGARDEIISRIRKFIDGLPVTRRVVSLRCAAKTSAGGAWRLPESVLDLGLQGMQEICEASRLVCYRHTAAFLGFFGRSVDADFADRPLEDQLSILLEPLLSYLTINDTLGPEVPRALIVQQMIYGDLDDRSLTGICYTRHPYTGEQMDYGNFLCARQGMALGGVHDPAQRDLAEMTQVNPIAYAALKSVFPILEGYYRAVRQVEFTAEGELLFLLQNTPGKSKIRIETP